MLKALFVSCTIGLSVVALDSLADRTLAALITVALVALGLAALFSKAAR